MSARHGGPGTYPAHDRAGTLDTSLTSTTSRSQQTHCADSQPATCPGSGRQRQTPAPSAAPRPGAVRIDTGGHTARQADRPPLRHDGQGTDADPESRITLREWHPVQRGGLGGGIQPGRHPAGYRRCRPEPPRPGLGPGQRAAAARGPPRHVRHRGGVSARTAPGWPPAAAARPSGSGPRPSRRATPAAGGSAAALSAGHPADAFAQTGIARYRVYSLIVHRQNQRSACGFLLPTVPSRW